MSISISILGLNREEVAIITVSLVIVVKRSLRSIMCSLLKMIEGDPGSVHFIQNFFPAIPLFRAVLTIFFYE